MTFPAGQGTEHQSADLEATLPVGQNLHASRRTPKQPCRWGGRALFQSPGKGRTPEKTGSTWAAERRSGISAATDIYAIGATLYYAVTGHKPENL